MSQQEIDIGSAPDAGDGDPIRIAWNKANENFTEVYGTLGTLGSVYAGTGHNHDLAYDAIGSAAAALADALAADFSGTYGDLAGIPSTFAPATHTHTYSGLAGLPTLGDLAALNLSGTAATFLNGTGGWGAPSASVAWGFITGTLTAQTDLQAALDAKQGTGAYLLGTYTSHNHDTLYSGTGHTHSIYLATSVPSATGYAVLTAASQAAGRTAIAAGTSNFDGVYGSLSGLPTLGSVSPLNTSGTAATFLNGTGGWTVPPGTATGGGAAGATVRYGRVTAVSSGTTTAYADVTGLSCGISPSETMQVHAYLMGGCSGTGGSRLTMTVPSGATANFYVTGNGATVTAYTMAVCTAGGQDPGVSFWNANATGRLLEIHGFVANGTTSGTIQVRRRSVVAANNTIVSVDSHLNGMVTS